MKTANVINLPTKFKPTPVAQASRRKQKERRVPGVPHLVVVEYESGKKVYAGRVPVAQPDGRAPRVWVQYEALSDAALHTIVLEHARCVELGARGIDPRTGAINFAELGQRYLAAKQGVKRSVRDDACRLKHLNEFLGRKSIASIDLVCLEQAVDRLAAEPVTRGKTTKQREVSTLNRYRALLKAVFRWARRQGLIVSNPAVDLQLVREDNQRHRILTEAEFARFQRALSQVQPKHSRFWRLQMFTGARQGEVLAARFADVDVDAAVWTIPHTKSGRARLVPLCDEALAIMRELQADRRSDFLFPARCGTRAMTRPAKAYAQFLALAGIEGLWQHDLRRSFATWAVRSESVSVHDVSRLLGHANVRTTERYLVACDQRLRHAASSAARMFSGHPGTTQSQKKPVLRLVPITRSVVIDARVRAVHARALCA